MTTVAIATRRILPTLLLLPAILQIIKADKLRSSSSATSALEAVGLEEGQHGFHVTHHIQDDSFTLLPPESLERNAENAKGYSSSVFSIDFAATLIDDGVFSSLTATTSHGDNKEDEEKEDGIGSDHTPDKRKKRKLSSFKFNKLEKKQKGYVQRERLSRGYGRLKWSADLLAEAQRWADVMALTNDYSHRRPLSQNIDYGWLKLAENVDKYWNVTYSGCHTRLMNSPEHRSNILKPDINRIGVGVRKSSDGFYYVCQIFKQVLD